MDRLATQTAAEIVRLCAAGGDAAARAELTLVAMAWRIASMANQRRAQLGTGDPLSTMSKTLTRKVS
jgi:hypothetical protein